jgi:hypothetical protein
MAEYLPLLLLRLSHSRNVAVLSLRTDGFLHNTDFSFVIWFTQLVEFFSQPQHFCGGRRREHLVAAVQKRTIQMVRRVKPAALAPLVFR